MSDTGERQFDLAERTANFAERVIELVKTIRLTAVSSPLVKQLVRAGTSVGANYLEADEAGSKKEFRYRISLCKRESRETQYWLRMLVKALPEMAEPSRKLWKEADELTKIFGTIYRRSKAAEK